MSLAKEISVQQEVSEFFSKCWGGGLKYRSLTDNSYTGDSPLAVQDTAHAGLRVKGILVKVDVALWRGSYINLISGWFKIKVFLSVFTLQEQYRDKCIFFGVSFHLKMLTIKRKYTTKIEPVHTIHTQK